MIDPSTLRRIGVFAKPNGYKGNVVLLDDGCCDIAPDMFVFLYDNGLPVPWRITEVRSKGNDKIVHLRGIESDTEAATLNGMTVYAEESALLPEEESDEILYTDLIGYMVTDEKGATIGRIDDVDDTTENVLLLIDTPSGRVMIPAADDFIIYLDTDNKIIEMCLPAGLMDLN